MLHAKNREARNPQSNTPIYLHNLKDDLTKTLSILTEIRNVKNYSFFPCFFFCLYDAKNLADDKLWMLGGATMDSFPKSQDAQLRLNEIIKDKR